MRAARPPRPSCRPDSRPGAPVAAQRAVGDVPVHGLRRPDAPLGDALQDPPLEVGMKFRSDEDGYITALRFYKQPNNTGTHVGHLWTRHRPAARRGQFRNETASGWQEERLPEPVAITTDTTYVTSYHSSTGPLRVQPRLLHRPASTGPPLHAPPTRCRRQRRLQVRAPAASRTRPSTRRTTGSTPSSSAPGRPTRARPGERHLARRAGASGSPPSSKVKVTFDEPLDRLTVNTGAFTLNDGPGATVPGAGHLRRARRGRPR